MIRSFDIDVAEQRAVETLRRKLTVAGEPQLMETVIGRGYRLRAEPATDAAP